MHYEIQEALTGLVVEGPSKPSSIKQNTTLCSAPPCMPMRTYPCPPPALLPTQQAIKSKRLQVKNACTNCQKACKKCDNSRPCLRCVKYGISEECVDSQRKERRKGLKGIPTRSEREKVCLFHISVLFYPSWRVEYSRQECQTYRRVPALGHACFKHRFPAKQFTPHLAIPQWFLCPVFTGEKRSQSRLIRRSEVLL